MRFFSTFLLALLTTSIFAQWQFTSNTSDLGEMTESPSTYKIASIDINQLNNKLVSAKKYKGDITKATMTISLPLPDGSTEEFKVWKNQAMHPKLAAKYPALASYQAVSVYNPNLRARLDMSSEGMHAFIFSKKGEIHVVPYSNQSKNNYLVFYAKDNPTFNQHPTLACGNHEMPSMEELAELMNHEHTKTPIGESIPLRRYRFALAASGEWGSKFSSKEQVLSRMISAVNRMNETLEQEISVSFELIENNDKIIFMDPTMDPYNFSSGHPGKEILGQNTSAINSKIGADAYDIGHVFTITCTDGIAGVARLASACTTLEQAAGLSCVNATSVGAIVNFVANVTIHELGHQFGASHTWSNCSESSQDQLSGSTAVEPCSGTTFMSYAGVCSGENNLQGTTSYYYNTISLEQMYNRLTDGGSATTCGTTEDYGNTIPTVTDDYTNGFTIPSYTPFELTASGADMDGDTITYCWEQTNIGPLSTCGDPIGNAPSFRSYPPTPEPTRTFPKMIKLLNNISDESEVLQTVSRDYKFRCTVRDNNSNNGFASWTEVRFKSTSDSGPFFVLQPNNADDVLTVGKEYSIQWDVANTDNDPVNCKNVDILLSVNGGKDFDIVLAEKTTNDGEHTVIVPNNVTSDARVKITASDNIFFDISNFDFSIEEAAEPGYYFGLSDYVFDLCTPDTVTVDIDCSAYLDYTDEVTFEAISDLPEGSVLTFDQSTIDPNGQATLTLDFANINATGIYNLEIRGTSPNADTLSQMVKLDLTSTNFDDHKLVYPTADENGVTQLPTFEWQPTINATSYTIEIGKNPALGDKAEIIETDLTETSFTPDESLDKNGLYYWRVIAHNKCKSASTPMQIFATESLSCRSVSAVDLPINITQSSTPVIESKFYVDGDGTITDVNVKKIQGTHSNVHNLTMTLISPSTKEVVLVSRKCNFSSDFNVGFDDEAASDVTCPLSGTYKPKEPLSAFIGDQLSGDWTLRINDDESGDGGKLQQVIVEVCSNAALAGPQLVNNNTFEVPTGKRNRLTPNVLLSEDANNTDEELMYTLLVIPTQGLMTINGAPVEIGSTFTQQDITNGAVRYQHNDGAELEDKFTFTVVDGEGGWIAPTDLIIKMDESFPSSTTDELQLFSTEVYPNPATKQMTININVEEAGAYSINIIDLTGRQLFAKNVTINQNHTEYVDVETFAKGMVIVQVKNGIETKSILTSVK